MSDIEDLYVWADGTTCREEDLEEYLTFMGEDDYELVKGEPTPKLVGKSTKSLIDWCNSDRV
jgi:hypothetical protein